MCIRDRFSTVYTSPLNKLIVLFSVVKSCPSVRLWPRVSLWNNYYCVPLVSQNETLDHGIIVQIHLTIFTLDMSLVNCISHVTHLSMCETLEKAPSCTGTLTKDRVPRTNTFDYK